MAVSSDQLQNALNAHYRGELETADSLYRAILVLDPDCAVALYGLGSINLHFGSNAESIELFRRAIQLVPSEAQHHQGMANALAKIGLHFEAISCFAEAVRLKPDFVQAWNDLGNSLRATRRYVEAENVYRRALDLKPDFVEGYCNLGLLLHEKGSLRSAKVCFQKGIQVNPDLPELHFNLGRLQEEIGELDEAEGSYRRALEIRPHFVEALNNLGGVLRQQRGRSEEARQFYIRAIGAAPSRDDARINLARLELYEGNVDSAHRILNQLYCESKANIEVASMLLQIEQTHCIWGRIEELSESILAGLSNSQDSTIRYNLSPINLMASSSLFTSEQLLRGTQGTLRRIRGVEPPIHRIGAVSRPADRRIKVGYLSSDFRIHPVGYLLPELIESHDRDRFEIIAYSTNNSTSDDIRGRLVKSFDRFCEVDKANDFEIARRIADDEVDILVDLGGHSHGSRFELLSWRPAPIQVTYLGYPGTTGAEYIDYIVVDEFVVPPSEQPFFSEKLVHLPSSFMVQDSLATPTTIYLTRSDVGLPEEAIVFSGFSQSYKISQPIFDVWLRILKSVPNSVLWLRIDDLAVREILLEYVKQSGIATDRILFALLVPREEHLARLCLADIGLDTFPYNQHSTCAEALRAGLPMVSLVGQTMASRVSGSLLRTLGLAELATTSLQAYEQKAIELGNSPALLRSIRQRLDDAVERSDMFSGVAFARKLEKAYLEMWGRYERGESPAMLTLR
jgi:protein O-GlcNAc transferase